MFKGKRTAIGGTLVVALFLSLLTLLTPGKALAAYDCFICLDGIQGESTYKGGPGSISACPGWIDVVSWSFGETQAATAGRTAGGRAAERVTMQDFKFTKRVDKASPILFQDCASGKHIPRAVLVVRRGVSGGPAGTTQQAVEYLKITMTNVLVSSFLNLGNSGSTQAYPIEEVSLNFGKIEIEYIEIGPDGKPKGSVKGGWDLSTNKKI